MKRNSFIFVVLVLALAGAACRPSVLVPSSGETASPIALPSTSAVEPVATLHPTVAATTEPQFASTGLNLEVLGNATYRLDGCALGMQDFTLVNGMFASSTDPSSPYYTTISLGEPVAFGDLNHDGVEDAAVLLAVNCGGSGGFVYLAAVLNDDDKPLSVASVFIEDRPIINTLTIENGEIRADTVLHGSADPMCCPTAPYQQGYRLYGNELALTYWAGETADGTPRTITITSPADLETVSYPFSVNGSVSIGQFENTLAFAVYTEDNTLVTLGSVMTDSPDMGAPGNFSLPLDLNMAGVTGWVRVEFAEYSMMDGSLVTLDSVLVEVR